MEPDTMTPAELVQCAAMMTPDQVAAALRDRLRRDQSYLRRRRARRPGTRTSTDELMIRDLPILALAAHLIEQSHSLVSVASTTAASVPQPVSETRGTQHDLDAGQEDHLP